MILTTVYKPGWLMGLARVWSTYSSMRCNYSLRLVFNVYHQTFNLFRLWSIFQVYVYIRSGAKKYFYCLLLKFYPIVFYFFFFSPGNKFFHSNFFDGLIVDSNGGISSSSRKCGATEGKIKFVKWFVSFKEGRKEKRRSENGGKFQRTC